MSDTRQALEEAFAEIHNLTVKPSDWDALGWNKADRFRRLLDAEAWTDAAMMLLPEGKGFCIMGNAAKVGKHVGVGDMPALALLAACLKARENGDG